MMSDLGEHDVLDGIAVIGMSGRFPGAKNLEEFWQNLRNGVESITFFSAKELEDSGINPAVVNHPNYIRARGVLDDIEYFDASFFNFSPKEAEITDPQQRLFLECAWESLEIAGYDSATYQGRIGVYCGMGINSYFWSNLSSNTELLEAAGDLQTLIANDRDYLASRVSYKLNLRGPSLTVQTACSTSLVAVHLACQSLLNYQCDMALAGGVNIRVPQKMGYLHQDGSIYSSDGHCRAFDADAQGTVFGNGLGVVLLKRLDEALADGDHIDAVIKGSAINNDGSNKLGYTAPSVQGQAAVIAAAQAIADIKGERLSYIEAHGTGTTIGDPLEIEALTEVFRATTAAKNFCALGSVKTNVGHLDTAAGITSLIKTILALKHKQLPPTLHFKQPNPKIDFANSPFYVNNQLTEWKPRQGRLRAGVSSFGIGGTNAHVILEDSLSAYPTNLSRRPLQLLLLSARTKSAVEVAINNLTDYLDKNPDLNLADVAYTLQVGRRGFEHRRAIVTRSVEDAVKALKMRDVQRILADVQLPKQPSIIFLFSGEWTQQVDTCQEFYQVESVFREQVDLCSELLKSRFGLDLRSAIFQHPANITKTQEQLKEARLLSQLALFTIEYALAKLWVFWGVSPQSMISYGIGEYAAACLAGVFSLEDALLLIGGAFNELPNRVKLSPPQIPFLSSVTGKWITTTEALNPSYWSRSLRSTRHVDHSFGELLQESDEILLEVGPGQTLDPSKTLIHTVISPFHHSTGGRLNVASMLTVLGQLWLKGVQINWPRFYAHEQRQRVPLPTYPFERKRYWVEAGQRQNQIPQTKDALIQSPSVQALEPSAGAFLCKGVVMEESPSSTVSLEQLIVEQLQIMSQQLTALDGIKGDKER